MEMFHSVQVDLCPNLFILIKTNTIYRIVFSGRAATTVIFHSVQLDCVQNRLTVILDQNQYHKWLVSKTTFLQRKFWTRLQIHIPQLIYTF